MTAKYQPVTREYKKYWIVMKPPLWGKMYKLRYYLGYSMSCIIRIMLDWDPSFVATIKYNNIDNNKDKLNLNKIKITKNKI